MYMTSSYCLLQQQRNGPFNCRVATALPLIKRLCSDGRHVAAASRSRDAQWTREEPDRGRERERKGQEIWRRRQTERHADVHAERESGTYREKRAATRPGNWITFPAVALCRLPTTTTMMSLIG